VRCHSYQNKTYIYGVRSRNKGFLLRYVGDMVACLSLIGAKGLEVNLNLNAQYTPILRALSHGAILRRYSRALTQLSIATVGDRCRPRHVPTSAQGCMSNTTWPMSNHPLITREAHLRWFPRRDYILAAIFGGHIGFESLQPTNVSFMFHVPQTYQTRNRTIKTAFDG
jgi:hypothetical protein